MSDPVGKTIARIEEQPTAQGRRESKRLERLQLEAAMHAEDVPTFGVINGPLCAPGTINIRHTFS